MNLKHRLSKIILSFSSVLILIQTFFLAEKDIWAADLFYYLPFFSLVIILDFMLYEISCPDYKGCNHLVFCTFPVSRRSIFIMEISYYLKRWELYIFVISILIYLSYFYFLNNTLVFPLILILILYIFQITYLIFLLFFIKNLFKIKNLELNVRNFSTILISFIILLYSFADKSKALEFVFYNNPFCCGFLSYLLEKKYALTSFSLIISVSGLLYLFGKNKINEWSLF
jgi:hypothetical protein